MYSDPLHNSVFPLPFALFIGPQRAGTSWLYRYFKDRSDTCLPHEVKELFYFDFNFDRGRDYYKSHFKIKPEHTNIIEITTTSFAHPSVPGRVYEYFGKDIKLVCPLRHPVERSYSLYLHYKRYGLVQGSLREAIRQKPEIIITSRYALHLKEWIDLFGRDNIHFCFQEHLDANQQEYVEDICDFLGLPFLPIRHELSGRYNAATKAPFPEIARLSQKIADYLRSKRLYWVINTAKRIGIKKFIFGGEKNSSPASTIPAEDYAILVRELEGEIEKTEALIGVNIPYWHAREEVALTHRPLHGHNRAVVV